MTAIETAARKLVELLTAAGIESNVTGWSSQSESTYVTARIKVYDDETTEFQIRLSDHNPGASTGRSNFYLYYTYGHKFEWSCGHNTYRYASIDDVCDDLIDDIKAEIE